MSGCRQDVALLERPFLTTSKLSAQQHKRKAIPEFSVVSDDEATKDVARNIRVHSDYVEFYDSEASDDDEEADQLAAEKSTSNFGVKSEKQPTILNRTEYAALPPGTVVQIQVGDVSLARKVWKKRRRSGSPLLVPCTVLAVERRSMVRWNLIYLLEQFGKATFYGVEIKLVDIVKRYHRHLKSSLWKQAQMLGFKSVEDALEGLFSEKIQELYGIELRRDENGMFSLLAPTTFKRLRKRAQNTPLVQFRMPQPGDVGDHSGNDTLAHTGIIRERQDNVNTFLPLSTSLRVFQTEDIDTGRVQTGSIRSAVVFRYEKSVVGADNSTQSPTLTLSVNPQGTRDLLKVNRAHHFRPERFIEDPKLWFHELKVGDGPFNATVTKLRRTRASVDLGVGRRHKSGKVLKIPGKLMYRDSVKLYFPPIDGVSGSGWLGPHGFESPPKRVHKGSGWRGWVNRKYEPRTPQMPRVAQKQWIKKLDDPPNHNSESGDDSYDEESDSYDEESDSYDEESDSYDEESDSYDEESDSYEEDDEESDYGEEEGSDYEEEESDDENHNLEDDYGISSDNMNNDKRSTAEDSEEGSDYDSDEEGSESDEGDDDSYSSDNEESDEGSDFDDFEERDNDSYEGFNDGEEIESDYDQDGEMENDKSDEIEVDEDDENHEIESDSEFANNNDGTDENSAFEDEVESDMEDYDEDSGNEEVSDNDEDSDYQVQYDDHDIGFDEESYRESAEEYDEDSDNSSEEETDEGGYNNEESNNKRENKSNIQENLPTIDVRRSGVEVYRKWLEVGQVVQVYIRSVSKQSGRFTVSTNPLVQGQKGSELKKERKFEDKLNRLKKFLGGSLDTIREVEGSECEGVVKALSKAGTWVYVTPDLDELPTGVATFPDGTDQISLEKGDRVTVRIAGVDKQRGQLAMHILKKIT